MQQVPRLLLVQGKHNVDGGLDLGGLVVEFVGLEAPGADGIERGSTQHLGPGHDAEILDGAGLSDHGLQHHGT
jgi:hypothetical protein